MLPFQKVLIFTLLLALLLTGCVQKAIPQTGDNSVLPTTPPVQASPTPIQPSEAPTATAPDPQAGSPEDVAVSFFNAYMEAVNQRRPTIGSPDFTAQQYLSEDFLKQVAEILAGFDGTSFDPVMKTQMTPPGLARLKNIKLNGDQAEVTLMFGTDAQPIDWTRTLSLDRIDGEWKIVPDRQKDGSKTPEETVEAFYAWYLAYINGGPERRNPLSDQAYRAAPYLMTQWIRSVDKLGEGENGFQYDPFLCAQNILPQIKAVSSYYNHGRPTVLMSAGPNHYLSVDLIRTDFNLWAINKITCGFEPEGVAKGFFTWALGYMDQPDGFHNPWVEGAYKDSQFLDQTLIEQLTEKLASQEPLPADPVLFAQDLPHAFNTQPCPEENCALVNLQYGDNNIQQLVVSLSSEGYPARIANIRPVQMPESPEPAEQVDGISRWVPYIDEQYGFSIRYPSDWRISGLNVSNLHSPEENRQARYIDFDMPVEEGYIRPFSIDVFTGDEAALNNQYPYQEVIREMETNGYTAKLVRDDLGTVRAIYRHPTKVQTWVIVIDPISQSPGGKELAVRVAGVFDAMLSTIVFGE
jgi:hypothetical protein